MSTISPEKRRLVAVSNRTAAGQESRAGGLAVALWDTLVASKGLWIGWSGKIVDFPRKAFHRSVEDDVEFALCEFTKEDYEGYYLGYSNSVLWPVMHSRVDLADFTHGDFDTYVAINKRFADEIISATDQNDLVWVHDYHFLLIAKFLKRAGWHEPIGFFLHIPFPSPDTFRAIPHHLALGEGLLSYDVIGLQTTRDVVNFCMYAESEFGAELLGEGRLLYKGRTVVVKHCPVGIDGEAFRCDALGKIASDAGEKLSTFLKHRDLVLGVDRMDYSKGLPQRFEGMARFFDKYPELHGKISFTQIAPPSRSIVDEYAHLREELDALSGRINGDYGDLDWIPIRYLARGYSREEIAGLYRLARICLVTPLQDGMNLVAKEFIAAQDPEDPGVLVLSQFAGAAEQMEAALIINPHDPDAIAEAVYDGLNMPLSERQDRYQKLWNAVQTESISWWTDRFLSAFKESVQA